MDQFQIKPSYLERANGEGLQAASGDVKDCKAFETRYDEKLPEEFLWKVIHFKGFKVSKSKMIWTVGSRFDRKAEVDETQITDISERLQRMVKCDFLGFVGKKTFNGDLSCSLRNQPVGCSLACTHKVRTIDTKFPKTRKREGGTPHAVDRLPWYINWWPVSMIDNKRL
jgi:hypothetical protein